MYLLSLISNIALSIALIIYMKRSKKRIDKLETEVSHLKIGKQDTDVAIEVIKDRIRNCP